MGYEIAFLRLRPGETFAAAYADLVARVDPEADVPAPWAPGPFERATWQRLVARLRCRCGSLAEIHHDSHVEVHQSEPRWVLRYHALGADLSAPLGYVGARADALVRRLYAVAEAVTAETGMVGFDRQLGEPIHAAEVAAAVTRYRRLAAFARRWS